MKKQFLKETGSMFLCIFAACLVNLAAMSLAVKIVNLFVEVDYFMAVIIRLIVSFVVVSGIIGAVTYLLSYKLAEFNAKSSLCTFSLAIVLQLLLCILLKFYPFIGGGTVYLAGIFESGAAFTSASYIEYIGFIDYLLAFVIFSAGYLVTLLICGKIGEKKRIRDREELLSNNQNAD